MNKYKAITAIILLIATTILVHAIPKAKYVGTNFISSLKVPLYLSDWAGQDVSYQVKLKLEEHPDKFSNDALAYQYINKEQKNLVFIILDAGNFHNPNVCFTGAGYEIEELKRTEFRAEQRTFKAHTLLAKINNTNSLSFYWIIIDKKIANEWLSQKVKQLYYSLLNKKRVGLMVRIDIPVNGSDINNATLLAKQFISTLSQSLPPEQADYIFGEK